MARASLVEERYDDLREGSVYERLIAEGDAICSAVATAIKESLLAPQHIPKTRSCRYVPLGGSRSRCAKESKGVVPVAIKCLRHTKDWPKCDALELASLELPLNLPGTCGLSD